MPSGAYGAAQGPSSNGSHSSAGSALLTALKDELFTLESERVEGKLNDAEYSELKSALEVVLRRALARQAVEK
jgi:hypothetical protein